MTRSRYSRWTCIALGAVIWSGAMFLIASSFATIHARSTRATELFHVVVPADVAYAPGDAVFLASQAGLNQIGEVFDVRKDGTVTLAIHQRPFAALTHSTIVECWQTPLTVEDALYALLPPSIQTKVADRVLVDWRKHRESLALVWQPLMLEIASDYLRAVGDDLNAAVIRHDSELWELVRFQGDAVSAAWPGIQERLSPILQEHLTPVLAGFINEAVSDAPKLNIAWLMARGRQAEAYQKMLDWLADYLVAMPDEDRRKMREALRATWEAARNDAVLVERFSALGRVLIEDDRLQHALTAIYREAISENPKTLEFLREEVVRSARIREQFYALLEVFAPTARAVASMALFDDDGATRPEIVQLVRSVALQRRVSWITLHDAESDGTALAPGATLTAVRGGGPH